MSDPVEDFERLPLRVFLDTNVVQTILTFGEYIFERHLSEKAARAMRVLGPKYTSDVRALANFLYPIERTPVQPIVSEFTIYELSRTTNQLKRSSLLRWGFDVLQYSRDNALPTNRPRVSIKDQPLRDFLPHWQDRILLNECLRTGCEAFITMDYKTILRHKSQLRAEGLTVMSPSDYWKLLRRWWNLWV